MAELSQFEPFRELPLDVEVRIDTVAMALRELLALEPGHVIRTARPLGEPLAVLVGDVLIGQGEVDSEAAGKAVRLTALQREEEW